MDLRAIATVTATATVEATAEAVVEATVEARVTVEARARAEVKARATTTGERERNGQREAKKATARVEARAIEIRGSVRQRRRKEANRRLQDHRLQCKNPSRANCLRTQIKKEMTRRKSPPNPFGSTIDMKT